MERILSISKSTGKGQQPKLEIKITGDQWAIVHLWGSTYYTEVSDNIPKSSIRSLALDFFRQKNVEKYVNMELKTVFE